MTPVSKQGGYHNYNLKQSHIILHPIDLFLLRLRENHRRHDVCDVSHVSPPPCGARAVRSGAPGAPAQRSAGREVPGDAGNTESQQGGAPL